MTMVLAIKDDESKFDMLVRNCVAHDGKRAPIQLVDQHGCVVRPKIMSRFQKIKNFGPSASVVSFAYFQVRNVGEGREARARLELMAGPARPGPAWRGGWAGCWVA